MAQHRRRNGAAEGSDGMDPAELQADVSLEIVGQEIVPLVASPGEFLSATLGLLPQNRCSRHQPDNQLALVLLLIRWQFRMQKPEFQMVQVENLSPLFDDQQLRRFAEIYRQAPMVFLHQVVW